jgi:hypothetical protein
MEPMITKPGHQQAAICSINFILIFHGLRTLLDTHISPGKEKIRKLILYGPVEIKQTGYGWLHILLVISKKHELLQQR